MNMKTPRDEIIFSRKIPFDVIMVIRLSSTIYFVLDIANGVILVVDLKLNAVILLRMHWTKTSFNFSTIINDCKSEREWSIISLEECQSSILGSFIRYNGFSMVLQRFWLNKSIFFSFQRILFFLVTAVWMVSEKESSLIMAIIDGILLICLGWIAPATPLLLSHETPLETGPMTNEQLSWIGSINAIGKFKSRHCFINFIRSVYYVSPIDSGQVALLEHSHLDLSQCSLDANGRCWLSVCQVWYFGFWFISEPISFIYYARDFSAAGAEAAFKRPSFYLSLTYQTMSKSTIFIIIPLI